ncbi:hypothetical protein HYFRA_00009612 [Hymenoscyphus fraxineus]|uniref:Uncharacterized protein n=1 Tax=Hymenoscyphus fraxineus TaxID=746836 RepID=A0A9N9KS54_9HELO|nr:hypothetical protein HYFRA_00009612 [Hymenoscyphus fraxineus]
MNNHINTQAQLANDMDLATIFELPIEVRDQIWEDLVHTGGHVDEAVAETGNLELVNPLLEVSQQLAQELDSRTAAVCDDMILIISSRSFFESINRIVPLRTKDIEQFIPKIALEITIWARGNEQTVMPFEMAMTTGHYLSRLVSFLNAQRSYLHLSSAEVSGFVHEILFEMDLNFSSEHPSTVIMKSLERMYPWFILSPLAGGVGPEWFAENSYCPRVNIQGLDSEIAEKLRRSWKAVLFSDDSTCLGTAREFAIQGQLHTKMGQYSSARAMYLLANIWLTQDAFPSDRVFDVEAFNNFTGNESSLLHEILIALSELSLRLGRTSEAHDALVYLKQELRISPSASWYSFRSEVETFRSEVEFLLVDALDQMEVSSQALHLEEPDIPQGSVDM